MYLTKEIVGKAPALPITGVPEIGHLNTVDVSCCNKVPQTGLKRTSIYCLTVLEAKGPKSGCWQDHAPSEAPRGRSFLPLPALGAPFVQPSRLCLTSMWWPSPRASVSPFTRRPTLSNMSHLNCICSGRLQIRSRSAVVGIRT